MMMNSGEVGHMYIIVKERAKIKGIFLLFFPHIRCSRKMKRLVVMSLLMKIVG